MQETIKKWGLGGLILGAFSGAAIVLVGHVSNGFIKSVMFYPLMMGIFAVPGALVGLFSGLIVALFCRNKCADR